VTKIRTLVNASVVRTMLIVLCFAMACALGNRLYALKDMTASAHHTLKPQSVETLALLSAPLDVEVLINPKDPQVETVAALFEKYRTHKPDVNVSFNDPALDPQRMRQLDVAPGGEIFIRYQNRTQRLTQLSESSLDRTTKLFFSLPAMVSDRLTVKVMQTSVSLHNN